MPMRFCNRCHITAQGMLETHSCPALLLSHVTGMGQVTTASWPFLILCEEPFRGAYSSLFPFLAVVPSL